MWIYEDVHLYFHSIILMLSISWRLALVRPLPEVAANTLSFRAAPQLTKPNDVGCSHQALPWVHNVPNPLQVVAPSPVTPIWRFELSWCHDDVMVMSWWCHDVSCGNEWNMYHNIYRKCHHCTVIFFEQISGNRAGLTEDVALALGIIVRCLRVTPKRCTRSKVWQRWTKPRWNNKRLTEMTLAS